MVPENALVFDTGPLRHFAARQWLSVLRFLADGRPVLIPESVERELKDAIDHEPAVHSALNSSWISVYGPESLDYIVAFADYERRLVADGKNRGECGVLALGQVFKCEVVLDDATPREIAKEKGIRVTATVPLLCNAVRAKKLTLEMVEALADDLLEGNYHLPFGPGGFRQHVLENALLDWGEV